MPEESLADVLAITSVVVLPYTAAYGGSAALNTALAARCPVLVSSVVYFEGAAPSQVFDPSPSECSRAILNFFSDRSAIEILVEGQAKQRSVVAIAHLNHQVRLGLEETSISDEAFLMEMSS